MPCREGAPSGLREAPVGRPRRLPSSVLGLTFQSELVKFPRYVPNQGRRPRATSALAPQTPHKVADYVVQSSGVAGGRLRPEEEWGQETAEPLPFFAFRGEKSASPLAAAAVLSPGREAAALGPGSLLSQ